MERRRKIGIALAVSAGVFILANRRRLAETAERIATFKIPTFYRQADSEWGQRALGFSGTTLASGGCLVTAFAMAQNALHPERVALNPGDVNQIAQRASAFEGPNLYVERAAKAIGLRAPDSERIRLAAHASTATMRKKIDDTLLRGGLAIVHVKHPGGFHFVLVYERTSDGRYMTADPAKGSVTIFDSDLTAEPGWTPTFDTVGVIPVYRS